MSYDMPSLQGHLFTARATAASFSLHSRPPLFASTFQLQLHESANFSTNWSDVFASISISALQWYEGVVPGFMRLVISRGGTKGSSVLNKLTTTGFNDLE
jgi:hypothetical protein